MSDDIHKFPSETADRFQIRLPDGMRKRIARAAERNNRSMNSEIVATLERHYPSDISVDELIKQTNELAKAHTKGYGDYNLAMLIMALREIATALVSEDGQIRPTEKDAGSDA